MAEKKTYAANLQRSTPVQSNFDDDRSQGAERIRREHQLEQLPSWPEIADIGDAEPPIPTRTILGSRSNLRLAAQAVSSLFSAAGRFLSHLRGKAWDKRLAFGRTRKQTLSASGNSPGRRESLENLRRTPWIGQPENSSSQPICRLWPVALVSSGVA